MTKPKINRTVLLLVGLLVGGGCLGMMLMSVAGIAGFWLLIKNLMTGTTPSKLALERLRQDAVSRQLLGENIQPGWWISGQIKINGPRGMASISIPVTGSEGSGTLHMEARRRKGNWCFLDLELNPGKGASLNLLKNSQNLKCPLSVLLEDNDANNI
ncbi:MAG TPA: cytochrome c oxidase assembly factor Coa1 family protein [Prochlorococcus sp.]